MQDVVRFLLRYYFLILSSSPTPETLGLICCWGRRGCDRMVAVFTNTYVISAYHH